MEILFKRYLVFMLFPIIALTSFNNKYQNKLKTGFYYLADSENHGELIKDIDYDETYAVDKNEILTVKDFSDIKLALKNFQPSPQRIIVVKLNKEGRKKWSDIVKRISTTGESIVFICNDKIYLEKRILNFNDKVNSTIDLFIEEKHQDYIYQIIKTEISNSR